MSSNDDYRPINLSAYPDIVESINEQLKEHGLIPSTSSNHNLYISIISYNKNVYRVCPHNIAVGGCGVCTDGPLLLKSFYHHVHSKKTKHKDCYVNKDIQDSPCKRLWFPKSQRAVIPFSNPESKIDSDDNLNETDNKHTTDGTNNGSNNNECSNDNIDLSMHEDDDGNHYDNHDVTMDDYDYDNKEKDSEENDADSEAKYSPIARDLASASSIDNNDNNNNYTTQHDNDSWEQASSRHSVVHINQDNNNNNARLSIQNHHNDSNDYQNTNSEPQNLESKRSQIIELQDDEKIQSPLELGVKDLFYTCLGVELKKDDQSNFCNMLLEIEPFTDSIMSFSSSESENDALTESKEEQLQSYNSTIFLEVLQSDENIIKLRRKRKFNPGPVIDDHISTIPIGSITLLKTWIYTHCSDLLNPECPELANYDLNNLKIKGNIRARNKECNRVARIIALEFRSRRTQLINRFRHAIWSGLLNVHELQLHRPAVHSSSNNSSSSTDSDRDGHSIINISCSTSPSSKLMQPVVDRATAVGLQCFCKHWCDCLLKPCYCSFCSTNQCKSITCRQGESITANKSLLSLYANSGGRVARTRSSTRALN